MEIRDTEKVYYELDEDMNIWEYGRIFKCLLKQLTFHDDSIKNLINDEDSHDEFCSDCDLMKDCLSDSFLSDNSKDNDYELKN